MTLQATPTPMMASDKLRAAAAMTASLMKLSIGSFVALAALMGIVSASGGMGWADAMLFALAVLGASGAAGAYNHYHERDTDRLMARTAGRPFATGRLKPGAVWPLSFLALLAGALFLALAVGGGLASLFVLLGALTYAVIYTVWLKRRSVWNVVIGGASGSFALLAGAAAAAPEFGLVVEPVPLILSAWLFLWTPPHFWALAAAKGADYRRAGIPMLPVVQPHAVWGPVIFIHVVFLVALSLGPLLYGYGALYAAGAIVGGAIFLKAAWRLMRDPARQNAMACFRASLIQFAALALGLFADRGLQWAL
ncbi:protoheme IX farnesyltransferase [Meinhardsimonia xiamenensis]|jgi:protoheme IX farnesyltransferase|uniref:Protoheme IX farnesyltransferase n=3 Tax=Meinhardsimonia xiamenensis TaxID=990712 RepID=A0A1G9DBS9_9RHOB|nr:heme o synthase [Meinhardsimonia xiamenensis]PRX38052.1 protoheme IX farnesyltransferase [Meinhardsimonia xiamenensis]SDK61351.1 protoheme IX farnesyltransferase [Meinhardsimonia xiamenensis]